MNKLFPVLNLLGYASIILVNYLAVSLPLNGKTPGEISDLYPTLFTPAGFTFSIWSVIYGLLLVFIIKQSKNLFKSGQPAPAFTRMIGPWFFLNCVANCAWLFAWHHEEFLLALAIMIAILATLIQIYQRLGIGRTVSFPENWFGVHLPFSIYLGWITVATIANVSVLLTSRGWEGGGLAPESWAVLVISIGTVIGLIMLFLRRDAAFGLVLVWAFFGIWSARSGELAGNHPLILTIVTSMVILAGLSGFMFWKRMRA